jgi:MFS family permease
VLNVGFAKNFGNTRRLALGSVFLVANAFIWYFLVARVLEEIINQTAVSYFEILLMWSLHFAAIAISTMIGSLLTRRIGRKALFLVWIAMGIMSPLTLIVFNLTQTLIVVLLSILFGASLGLGMPNCMEYFATCTRTENRGRYGGIIMLISGLGLVVLGIIDIGTLELPALVLVLWRLSSLLFVMLQAKPFNENTEKGREVTYGFVLSQKSFILYVIPWVMFSLVNQLSTPVQFGILGKSEVEFLMFIENALLGLFAVVGGFFSDYVGRKRMAIAGFVLLGLGFSILGLYPANPLSWYFYTIVDGIAWGLLFVIFVITVWGDLSHETTSDKYYAIGVLPFFLSKYLQLVLGNFIADFISPYALFSFAAFFLFLAVLPLMYAPETLPEKHIKERELKSYIEKAKKEAAKAQKKEEENTQRENEDVEVEFEVNQEDYEEKLKEAEKYY